MLLSMPRKFVKIYLQGLLNRGYAISEAENKEPWKLEKKRCAC